MSRCYEPAQRLKILRFIGDFIQAHGYPPTLREIMTVTGIRSTSTVHEWLVRLKNDGYIYRDQYTPRSLALTDEGRMLVNGSPAGASGGCRCGDCPLRLKGCGRR